MVLDLPGIVLSDKAALDEDLAQRLTMEAGLQRKRLD